PLYVMETDKATTEVESPYDGKLVEWSGKAGTVYPIGAEIGKMEVAAGVKEMAAGHGPPGESHASPAGEAEARKPEAKPQPPSAAPPVAEHSGNGHRNPDSDGQTAPS